MKGMGSNPNNCILDGQFFTFICCKILMFVKETKINYKDAEDGLFKKRGAKCLSFRKSLVRRKSKKWSFLVKGNISFYIH